MKQILTVIIPVSIGVIGQMLLKQGVSSLGKLSISLDALWPLFCKIFTNIWILSGLFLYALSAFLWIIVLSRMELSVAYPLLSMGYILVLLFSWIFFKEDVNFVRWMGVVIICLGVFFISKS